MAEKKENKRCLFFSNKKKRFCKFLSLPNSKYCFFHQIDEENSNTIHCNYCNTVVYKKSLKKHLQKCPKLCYIKKQKDSSIFISNINKNGEINYSKNNPVSLNYEYLNKIKIKIEKAYESLPTISNHYKIESNFKPFLDPSKSRQYKHSVQIASLLSRLSDFSALPISRPLEQNNHHDTKSIIWVELGAGKGKFSLMFNRCFPDIPLLLIDQNDKYMRHGIFQRLRININDLNLCNLSSLQNHQCIFASKHLCGSNTDTALRCITNLVPSSSHSFLPLQSNSSIPTIRAMIFACCCYGKCQYSDYISIYIKSFLSVLDREYINELGFHSVDFTAISTIACWDIDQSNIYNEERKQLGKKAKAILDFVIGRLFYLSTKGYIGRVIQYVSEDISLENQCIIAIPNTALSLRQQCRQILYTNSTAGLAPGFVQCNVVILPAGVSDDFELFCQYNSKSCPLLERLPLNSFNPTLFTDQNFQYINHSFVADIRSDLPKYHFYQSGQNVQIKYDISNLVEPLLVNGVTVFLLGCSFSFEELLISHNINLRHIEEHKTIPMYRTNLPCKSVGIFKGNMVVSMRPLKTSDVETAFRITSQLSRVHGSPIHSGNPSIIGIDDLSCPDWGDCVTIYDDEIPVFWACGVTSQNALSSALTTQKLEWAICHAPGHMFVSDILTTELIDP